MFRTDDPVALFDAPGDGAPALRLSALVSHLSCTEPAELDTVFARIEAAGRAGHWVALAARYELGHGLEARLAPLHRPGGPPLLEAWIFARADALSDAQVDAWLDEAEGPAGLYDLRPGLSRARYLAAVERIRRYIHAGDCYQTNFTFPCHARAYGAPRALYRRLRSAQPVRHGALIEHRDGVLMSRSPELFVQRTGARLVCRPMKGTAPAAAGPEALTGDPKNRAENLMIVDLIRNDLGRLAPPGQVRVSRLFEAEAYPTLWQMTSTIEADGVDAPLAAVFRALFPCGSVTGAPKIRAMQIIDELELGPRGIYCGALGWIAPTGDFAFNVPIRTLEITPHGQVRYGTGSGIVADSEPEREWEECLLKTRVLTHLPDGLGLIETLRCNGGHRQPLPWFADHLARLADSAAALGLDCPLGAIEAALSARAEQLRGPHRLRLELSPDGRFRLDHAPLVPTPARPTVALCDTPISSSDPLLRHKTTHRRTYDRLLADAMAQGHFDVLCANDRGELTEGCRSSLFLELNGRLLTPPLSAGVLDGICRRRLLRDGRAQEATLRRNDLQRASRIYLGNALRGLVQVRLNN